MSAKARTFTRLKNPKKNKTTRRIERMKKLLAIFAVLMLAAVFVSCGGDEKPAENTDQGAQSGYTQTDKTTPPEETTPPPADSTVKETPTMDLAKTIVIETDLGNIEVTTYADTPIASKNFIDKAQSGFYNGITFHRIVKSFVIQGGDPSGNGTGGGQMGLDPKGLHPEKRGTLAMASSSQPPLAHQSDAQFFINLVDNYRLDEMGFIAFAEVTSGMDIVDKIVNETPTEMGGDGAMSKPIKPVIMKKVYVK